MRRNIDLNGSILKLNDSIINLNKSFSIIEYKNPFEKRAKRNRKKFMDKYFYYLGLRYKEYRYKYIPNSEILFIDDIVFSWGKLILYSESDIYFDNFECNSLE